MIPQNSSERQSAPNPIKSYKAKIQAYTVLSAAVNESELKYRNANYPAMGTMLLLEQLSVDISIFINAILDMSFLILILQV